MVLRRQVIILTYHGIMPQRGNGRTLYKRPLNEFRMDLERIVRLGYSVISFRELLAILAGKEQLQNDAIILTFDDGLMSQFDYAMPVLRDHGMKATFFITTTLMGTKDYFVRQRILDTLDPHLFEVESHGYKHINYKDLDHEQLMIEMQSAHRSAQMIWPKTSGILALPYGDVNTDDMQAAARVTGFSAVRTALGGAIAIDRPGEPVNRYSLPSYLLHEYSDLEALLSRRSRWPNTMPGAIPPKPR